MPTVFHITHIEATPRFVLYHLDGAKQGIDAIVSFRRAPEQLEPTLAMLHRRHVGFDFEIETEPNEWPFEDPRLRTACRVRALTLPSDRPHGDGSVEQ